MYSEHGQRCTPRQMSNFLWGCSQLTNMGNMLPSEWYEPMHLSHKDPMGSLPLSDTPLLSFFFSYIENICISEIIRKKINMKMHKRECDDQSDVLKQKLMCMNHMLHYRWVFHSRSLSAVGDLSSVFT